MIRFSQEEGFIRPKGIKFKQEQNSKILLPKVAVGVFSKHLFYHMVEEFEGKEVGYIYCTSMDRDVYILKYKNTEITFFMAGVSGPWISSDIEELHAQGVEKFIIFGNCGVLDSNIEDCSIIIPTMSFRDEGTSYHYMADSETIDLNPKYVNEFIDILNKNNFNFYKGFTWTTDAFYRETREKIEYFKSRGAICVEMEGSVIAAVCKRLNIEYFTFYYAGDNLDATEWEERSLLEHTNFSKKKEVSKLALELAKKISQ